MQAQQEGKAAGGADNNGRKRGEMDTDKSIEELSDDDLSFMPQGDDPGVHEGGRESRPGSQEMTTIQRRRN